MRVLLFEDRFAALVATGEKTQTIRAVRKRPINEGEELSLRKWLGRPYASKQVELRRAVCAGVQPILIEVEVGGGGVEVGGLRLLGCLCEELARRDGFATAADLLAWFREVYGLPFHGDVISWRV